MKVNVIIPCGGRGIRCGLEKNKLFATLGDVTVIERTIAKFAYIPSVHKMIFPCSSQDTETMSNILATISTNAELIVCKGGVSRTESVLNAMKYTDEDCDVISIHDGARPFVSEQTITESFRSALTYGSGIAGHDSTDTIAIVDGSKIITIPNRATCAVVQTPQSFRASEIRLAYSHVQPTDTYTDDSAVYAMHIGNPTIVQSDATNRKITFASDLNVAENMFVGTGYDTHRLVPNRELVLGGLNIPYKLGLLGHSDADVLTHAIMDAILNACGERDIGVLFPDTDTRYKGIESVKLLDYVCKLIHQKDFRIKNISAVIMCEKPKMAPIISDMRHNLAKIMEISYESINISATTTEGLGWIGREEGIASRAVCLCYKIN